MQAFLHYWCENDIAARRSPPAACAKPPPRVELAVGLRDRDQGGLGRLHQLPPGDDRERARAAEDLRVEGQEQFVDETRGEQMRVERRASLAEHRAHAVVLVEIGHEAR